MSDKIKSEVLEQILGILPDSFKEESIGSLKIDEHKASLSAVVKLHSAEKFVKKEELQNEITLKAENVKPDGISYKFEGITKSDLVAFYKTLKGLESLEEANYYLYFGAFQTCNTCKVAINPSGTVKLEYEGRPPPFFDKLVELCARNRIEIEISGHPVYLAPLTGCSGIPG